MSGKASDVFDLLSQGSGAVVLSLVVEQRRRSRVVILVGMCPGNQSDDQGVVADRNQLIDLDPHPAGGTVQNRLAGIEYGPEGLVGKALIGATGKALRQMLLMFAE